MQEKHPIDLYLGEKLVNIRKKRGLSQDKLSESMLLSRQQIQKYETGETRIPTSTLYDISRILNINMNYFLEGIDKICYYELPDNNILQQKRSTPLKILIIEDNASDERLTREAITSVGYSSEIHHISDGAEALAFLKNIKKINTFPRPDIIFLDLNIPKRKGIEVLKDIKNDHNIKDIPVIVITNSVSAEEMRNIYKNGASGFIVKSFYVDEFYNKIKILLDYWYNMILPSM